jgi:2-polyprenyl-6-hydroxyphenyl methylase/3-demethylubiquinone-9 3-methyltransferase
LITQQHAEEVSTGQRFEFGKNWTAFLTHLNEHRIGEAVQSLQEMLEVQRLDGKTFLDIGSGSGLFSLAARRMGAKVFSFDYDPHSVACTQELRRRYYPNDPDWTVESGSVLDAGYLEKLGRFDIVYSWGVLHHTGNLWQALENIIPLVAQRGKIFIALYNDQGGPSRRWLWVKRTYNRHPVLRLPLLLGSFWRLYWRPMLQDLLLLRPGYTFRRYQQNRRGMTVWRDLIDWVGGYPFEVSKAEDVFHFYRKRGFVLTRLVTDCDLGCNQLVMVRVDKLI